LNVGRCSRDKMLYRGYRFVASIKEISRVCGPVDRL
jgi:hypothetical protein